MSDMKKAAEYYAKHGFAVVPLKPRSKVPMLDDWGNHTLTADDVSQFWDRYPDANIGIELGKSKVCSLDIDCADSARIIFAEFGWNLDDLISKTPTIKGKSSGYRLMFSVPEGVELDYCAMRWPKADASGLYTVFELRYSANGKARQDVVPPSIHPDTGQAYSWHTRPSGRFPEPPQWLIQLWLNFDKLKAQLLSCCPWAVKQRPQPPQQAKLTGHNGEHDYIRKFNGERSIAVELERYGYTRCGNRWLSPHSTTGLPGVVLFDDNRAWIHHSSDPLCSDESGNPVGPFDLFKQYEHNGDNTRAFGAIAKAYEPKQGVTYTPANQRSDESKEERNTPNEKPLMIQWKSLKGKEPPMRQWAIDHWLGFGHPTLLVGPGGVGKTLLTQQVGSHLALGRKFIDDVPRSFKVLIWGCEDDHDEFWRRQLCIANQMGVPLEVFDGQLMIQPRLGADNTLLSTEFGRPLWTPLVAELSEMVADLDIDVVAIDNQGQTFGANEIARHDVTMFLNGITGACQKRKQTAQLLLSHPSRQAGSEFAGSGAWENAVRMRWWFGDKLPDAKPGEDEQAPEDDVRFLCKRKTNYSRKDYRKLLFRAGAFVCEDIEQEGGSVFGSIHRQQQARRIIKDGLRTLARMQVWASEVPGTNYLPKLLMQYKLNEDVEKSVIASALRELMLDGEVFKTVIGKFANRTDRFGLVVKD